MPSTAIAKRTGPTDVLKHSAAIQITNQITLLQRRAWNVLLANAYDELPNRRRHTMSVNDLVDALGITTRNTAHLRDMLQGLTTTALTWNVLGKDGKQKWGAASLLGYFEFEGGVCVYDFGGLSDRLYNPVMYARIKLATANKFNSKHALALYELCVDYLGVWQTPWMEIADFRRLMGIPEGEYERWYDLNRKLVEQPVAEINALSDIRVKVEKRKKGRSYSAVKFMVQPKAKTPAAAVAQVEGARRPLAVDIEREVDPFDVWFDALLPLERSALQSEARAAAEKKDPKAKGVMRTVLEIEFLRKAWQEREG